MSPGVMIKPLASMVAAASALAISVATAAIFPSAMARSMGASTLFAGSIVWPFFNSRSYVGIVPPVSLFDCVREAPYVIFGVQPSISRALCMFSTVWRASPLIIKV